MGIQVDLTGLDLCDVIEQEAPSTRFGRAYGNGEKRTRKGTCPWCGGTDRFAVVESEPQHFYCGIHGGQGCGRHGDAVSFMQQWHDIRFMEACERLDIKPVKDGEAMDATRHAGKMVTTIDRKPDEGWRNIAEYFLTRCQVWLQKDTGRVALTELHRRGFTDEMIHDRGYGYNPKTLFDKDVARWGITDESVKAVWLPRGIVIPWRVGSDLWKLSVRRPRADLQAEGNRNPNKYISIKGGSNAIYRVDTIQAHKPLIIFEGEFNADILAQVLNETGITDIATIATGSTGKGRADNWLVKIAKASPIIISFDPDGGGASAAKDHWSKVLPHALLWPCVGGDMNDMHMAGNDVMKWLRRGLRLAGSSVIPDVTPPSHQPTPEPETALFTLECSSCGRKDTNTEESFFFDDDGTCYEDTSCYCPTCWEARMTPPEPLYDAKAWTEHAIERMTTEVSPLHGSRIQSFHESEYEQVKQTVIREYREKATPPTIECRFCKTRRWIPYEPEGWICLKCLSPAYGAVTLRGEKTPGVLRMEAKHRTGSAA